MKDTRKCADGLPDLTPYAGQWVAVAEGRVIGVGRTREEAYLAAKGSRPKEMPAALLFIPARSINEDTLSELMRRVQTHPLLTRVRDFLAAQGIESYLVGGTVRDFLLNRECHDLDLVVAGSAQPLARRLADFLGAGYYPLDIGRNVHRVVCEGSKHERIFIDLMTMRGDTIEDDLRHRDFTIGAMAASLDDWRFIDPFGGLSDLEQRRLRLVSPESIAADPIRALRAVRFSVELALEMDASVIEAIRRDIGGLASVSAERVRDEFFRILNLSSAAEAVRRMHALDLIRWVLPELLALEGIEQSAPHRLDVWEHTLLGLTRWEDVLLALDLPCPSGLPLPAEMEEVKESLANVREHVRMYLMASESVGRPRWLLMKCGALCHDLGKPATRQVEEGGRIRFFGHEHEGAHITQGIAERLHLAKAEADFLKRLSLYHVRPLLLAQSGEEVSRRAAHRYFRDAGETGVGVALLSLADHLALKPGPPAKEAWRKLLKVVSQLLAYWYDAENPERIPPLVTGHDLIALGLPPGPALRHWLVRVREEQISGTLSTREEALHWLQLQIDTSRRGE